MNFFQSLSEVTGINLSSFLGPAPVVAEAVSGKLPEPQVSIVAPQVSPALHADTTEAGQLVSLKSFDSYPRFQAFIIDVDPQSKKMILKEEVLLVVSDKQLILLKSLATRLLQARVLEVYELLSLAKLKYSKTSSSPVKTGNSASVNLLVLELKSGRVLRYMLKDSILFCVNILKERMEKLGVTGSTKKSAKTRRDIANATHCMEESLDIEQRFTLDPSFELVEEMMDLLRVSTEKFSEANEAEQFQKAITHIQSFLKRDDVIRVLDEHRQQQPPQPQSQSPAMTEKTEAALVPPSPETDNVKEVAEKPVEVFSTPVRASPAQTQADLDLSASFLEDIHQQALCFDIDEDDHIEEDNMILERSMREDPDLDDNGATDGKDEFSDGEEDVRDEALEVSALLDDIEAEFLAIVGESSLPSGVHSRLDTDSPVMLEGEAATDYYSLASLKEFENLLNNI